MQVDLSLSGGLAPGLCSLVLLLSGRLAVLPRKRLLLRHQEGRTTAGEGGAVGGCSHFCRFRMCGGGSEGEQMGQRPGVWVLGVRKDGRAPRNCVMRTVGVSGV